MSKNKKSYHSFKEVATFLKEENKENYEKYNMLLSYGIEIPLEDIERIDILKSNKKFIFFLDKCSGQYYTSNLIAPRLDDLGYKHVVYLMAMNQNSTFFTEKYNKINEVKTYEEAGKEALKARKKKESLLIERAYADINTKYGDFCLLVEQKYSEYEFGPHFAISLYHGYHNKAMERSNGNFKLGENCIFRYKYSNEYNFNQWILGYVYNNIFQNPTQNRWEYRNGITKEREEIEVPIYCAEDRLENLSGVIILNGRTPLNEKCIPELFNFDNQFDEFEQKKCTSKMYFKTPNRCVAIIKQEDKIGIYCKDRMRSYIWEQTVEDTILPSTFGEFTPQNLETIASAIEKLQINEELKHFIIKELKIFKNLHKQNKISELKEEVTLKDYQFESTVQLLQNQDLTTFTEELIKSVASTFEMNAFELLGDYPSYAREELQRKRNLEKKD